MSNILVKGIMPAMVTPIDKNGAIIEEGIRKSVERNLEQGAAGFYICGSTGEGPVLSTKKRMTVAETTVDAVKGRGLVINHVGAASFDDAFILARHAKSVGCDAISSVAPNFYFQYTEDEVVDYYKRLAYESELPVLAYAQNLYKGDMVELMKRLIEVEGIIGVKFTFTDYYSLHRIKELNGGDINVINGPDEMLICGLSMGADAGIGSTYNLMCREYCKLFAQFRAGDIEAARATQYKVNKITEILIKYNVSRAVKYVFTKCYGIESGYPAYPMTPLSEDEGAQLINELTQAGFFTDYNN